MIVHASLSISRRRTNGSSSGCDDNTKRSSLPTPPPTFSSPLTLLFIVPVELEKVVLARCAVVVVVRELVDVSTKEQTRRAIQIRPSFIDGDNEEGMEL